MINCSLCHKGHVDNTIFCGECGDYMLEGTYPKTDEVDQIGWMGSWGNSFQFDLDRRTYLDPATIRLSIETKNREFELPLDKSILIGRVDPTIGVFPEVDLTNEVPKNNISRRHARILKREGGIFVEDSGSFNGTFVNGRRLAPYLPEALRDGDTLQLGGVLIEVKFLQ